MAVYLDFLVIPTPVLRSSVPDSAKIIYGVIYALSQLSSGGCTASNETLMQIANISNERTLHRGLAALEEKRLIKRYINHKGQRLAIRPLVVFGHQKSVDNLGKSLRKSGAKGVTEMTPPPDKNDTRKRKQEKESFSNRDCGNGAEPIGNLLSRYQPITSAT